ncbi:acetyltransferase [Desulfocurvibacter africanus PCS]|uniref:Acetyltransferase n=1 Tax=Desulfocurvibacter africanus PCS TaxID=1262666 RepID=M5PR06_DESAF|nr:GNAT family N-acetyltransferase [Desulfocurvibacter africanus]EMG36475.1 acetyltransferase [Desulfocurvibacter africanus PCS]
MDIELCHDLIAMDWPEAAALIRVAGLGEREPEKMRRAWENSHLVCVARVEGRLVGLGRAISDGEFHAVIYDVAVLPEFQGKGLGRRIMDALLNGLPMDTVLLYAVPGKQGFYKQFGFEPLLTGMARFQRRERMKTLGYIP